MQFTDTAIILSTRKHGEHSAIVRALTQAHGVYAGLVRGSHGKHARGLWQPGNRVVINWKARLADQLGTCSGELVDAVAAFAMREVGRLAALSSAAALTALLMPERAPHPLLYTALEALTTALKTESAWPETYARFEVTLLAECGFRLDFSACAATGATGQLIYVSPKSGRAVSAAAGAPYKNRLMKLPEFLLAPCPATNGDILHALRMTGYFLEQWALNPHEKTLPAARSRLMEWLRTHAIDMEQSLSESQRSLAKEKAFGLMRLE